MDRLDAMRVFTRVVERCSFTLAAEDLGLPRSTATEAVKMLEARLGVSLLHRTTRHVRPTPDGEHYYHRCMALLADLENVEAAFTAQAPQGVIRVSVHGTLARHFLLPHLPAFLADYPGLRVEMRESDRLVNVVEEGFECVLRVGLPRDSDLMIRKVADLDEVTLASPDYVARRGLPASLDALRADGHQMVGFWCSAINGAMPLEFVHDGAIVRHSLPTALIVSAAESYVAAARHGLGLIQIPRYHAAADLEAGRLIELLPQVPPPATQVSLLFPRTRHLAPRIRVFMEWVQRCFDQQAAPSA